MRCFVNIAKINKETFNVLWIQIKNVSKMFKMQAYIFQHIPFGIILILS